MRTMLFQNPIRDGEFEHGHNTFRDGDNWADLRIGERIKLAMSDKPNEPICEAIIRGVVVDTLGILLSTHALNNHCVVDEYTEAWAANEALHSILTKIYGPLEGHRTFTAVYLDRVQ